MLRDSQDTLGQSVGGIWQRMGNNRLFLLGLLGIVILLAMQILWPRQVASPVPHATQVQANEKSQAGASNWEQIMIYRQAMEKQLAEILSEVNGIGKVKVMLSMSSGSEVIPAMNVASFARTTEEKDSNGGTRVIKKTAAPATCLLALAMSWLLCRRSCRLSMEY